MLHIILFNLKQLSLDLPGYYKEIRSIMYDLKDMEMHLDVRTVYGFN